MKLSVIIPVYNAAATIVRCLDSLCREIGNDQEVEVICIDDGSVDDSAMIIATYERVSLVRQANSGVATARNVGLSAARGEYVAWVDSDDEVCSGWWETIRQELEDKPDILSFDSRWTKIGSTWKGRRGLGGAARTVDARHFLLDVLRGERIGCHLWMHVFRRALFDGLAFDSAYDGMEDFMLLPEVVLRADTVHYVPRELYHYIVRKGSYTQGGNASALMKSCGIGLRDEKAWTKRCGGVAGRAVVTWKCLVLHDRLLLRRKDNGDVGSKEDCEDAANLRRLVWTACCDGGASVALKLRFLTAALGLWQLRKWRWRRD